MSLRIGVDCRFTENGTVRVRRIKMGKSWIGVGQGRQWQDGNGRHLLIMLPSNTSREIVLRPAPIIWELLPEPGTQHQLA